MLRAWAVVSRYPTRGIRTQLCVSAGAGEAYYRYSKSNGNNLKFSAEGFNLFLNDRLIGVKISEDPALLDWLNALTPEEIADLQNLVITDSLSTKCLNGVANLALLKHDPCIVFYVGINSTNAEEILKLFNPAWLVSQGELNKSGIDRLYSFTEIEWLYINNQNLDADRILNLKKMKNLKLLSDLPGLSCLSIVGDTIPTATFFDFKNLDSFPLPVALPEDSLLLKELKGKLPNTIIVPSKGLCLGTGWLLLVFPLFFLMSLSGYFIRKRTRA